MGLTQKQAASALGVNPWTVLNWEAGRFEPPIRSMPAILDFLGYDPFPRPSTVGERLLRVRRQHGWSTSEAGRQLGVDRATWQDWEHGELILFRKHRTNVAALPRSARTRRRNAGSVEQKASALGIPRILAKNDRCHTSQQFHVYLDFDNWKTWGDPRPGRPTLEPGYKLTCSLSACRRALTRSARLSLSPMPSLRKIPVT